MKHSYIATMIWAICVVILYTLLTKNQIYKNEKLIQELETANKQLVSEVDKNYVILAMDESCATQLENSNIVQLKLMK